MRHQAAVRDLDRDFVTIYFLQGEPGANAVALKRIYLILGIIAFLFAMIFLRVWIEMRIVQVGYQVAQIRHEVDRRAEEKRVLLSRRNALASLERVEEIARRDLGLQAPAAGQLIFLEDPAETRGPLPRWLDWSWVKDSWWRRLWGQPTPSS